MDLWQRYLSIYHEAVSKHCEKALGFISEPVNTISNIAFFISVYFVHKITFKSKNPNIKRLFWMALSIAIGSTVYHGFNSPYTLIIDQAPIYAFLLYSLYLITGYISKSRIVRLSIPLALILIQALVLKNIPAFLFFNTPTSHVFNLIFVSVLIFWFYRKLGKVALNMIPPVLVYGLGILTRTLDPVVCPVNKFGTHALWHILMATTIYLTVRFLVELDKSRKV